jgi:hypothetical protein
VWFNELLLYPLRNFTYCNEQVRADEVQREVVCMMYHWSSLPLQVSLFVTLTSLYSPNYSTDIEKFYLSSWRVQSVLFWGSHSLWFAAVYLCFARLTSITVGDYHVISVTHVMWYINQPQREKALYKHIIGRYIWTLTYTVFTETDHTWQLYHLFLL